jgi:hypothetical protein
VPIADAANIEELIRSILKSIAQADTGCSQQ